MWKWEENSVLYSNSPYVLPRDIFQAVCNEVGRYYQEKELQYVKSKRELKWEGTNLWCKLGLWSSHSNIQGKWVAFEIVTSLFAIDNTEMERKGILSFGFRPKHFNIYGIDLKLFNEITSYIDSTLMRVKEFDTKNGLEKFLLTNQKSVFVEASPNNLQYLRQLGLDK